MVAEKTMNFQGKNKNLQQFSDQVVQKLQADGYKTQVNTPPDGIVIQATKAGLPRDLIAADRAFTIAISGKPDNFSVKIGIGKLIQNLGVTAVETIALSGLFLAVDVPEMLWTKHVEDGIAKEISDIAQGSDGNQPKGNPQNKGGEPQAPSHGGHKQQSAPAA
jgi:hypothetical protein